MAADGQMNRKDNGTNVARTDQDKAKTRRPTPVPKAPVPRWPALSDELKRRLREAGAILLIPLALYLLMCLFSYNDQDPSWGHAASWALPACPQLGS